MLETKFKQKCLFFNVRPGDATQPLCRHVAVNDVVECELKRNKRRTTAKPLWNDGDATPPPTCIEHVILAVNFRKV